jgi:hypothetical protein
MKPERGIPARNFRAKTLFSCSLRFWRYSIFRIDVDQFRESLVDFPQENRHPLRLESSKYFGKCLKISGNRRIQR